MALTEAKCTNCGANVKVDPATDAAVCEYCGAAFVVEKAIHNYNIANAQITAGNLTVNVGGSSPTVKSILQYADSIRENEPIKALAEYESVLRIEPNNYEARFFKLVCDVMKDNVETSKLYTKQVMRQPIRGAEWKVFSAAVQSVSWYGEPTKPIITEERITAIGKFVDEANDVMATEDYKRIAAYYQKNIAEAYDEAKRYYTDLQEAKGKTERFRNRPDVSDYEEREFAARAAESKAAGVATTMKQGVIALIAGAAGFLLFYIILGGSFDGYPGKLFRLFGFLSIASIVIGIVYVVAGLLGKDLP